MCPQRPVDVKLGSFMRNMEEQPVCQTGELHKEDGGASRERDGCCEGGVGENEAGDGEETS